MGMAYDMLSAVLGILILLGGIVILCVLFGAALKVILAWIKIGYSLA